MVETEAFAADDQQARKVRLLLLGKGVVSAHGIELPFAAQLDEYEQRPPRNAGRDARCSFDKRASPPAGSTRLLGTTSERLDWFVARLRIAWAERESA